MRLAGFTKSIFHLSCCDRIYFSCNGWWGKRHVDISMVRYGISCTCIAWVTTRDFANAPYPQLAGVSIGIAISTFVTFICAAILLKLPNKEKRTKRSKKGRNLGTIYHSFRHFACDSGMGSSAMGAALLKRN